MAWRVKSMVRLDCLVVAGEKQTHLSAVVSLQSVNHATHILTPGRIPTDTAKESRIYPLPHSYVVKDLVPVLTHSYKQHKSIKPYLQRTTPPAYGRENIQSQADRAKLDGLYECILCASPATGETRRSTLARPCRCRATAG